MELSHLWDPWKTEAVKYNAEDTAALDTGSGS